MKNLSTEQLQSLYEQVKDISIAKSGLEYSDYEGVLVQGGEMFALFLEDCYGYLETEYVQILPEDFQKSVETHKKERLDKLREIEEEKMARVEAIKVEQNDWPKNMNRKNIFDCKRNSRKNENQKATDKCIAKCKYTSTEARSDEGSC